MQRAITILLGAAWSLGLLIFGLWAWRDGVAMVRHMEFNWPAAEVWAVRAGAVAVIGLGEALLALLVLGNVWRRDRWTDAMGLVASVIFVIGGAAAVALGVMGR
jgi:hypothetical protein